MQHYQVIDIPIETSRFDLVIDARSPSEFAEDHAPGAINLPVLTDQQRHEVGTIYKRNAFKASRLGAALITENVSKFLVHELADYPHHTSMLVYCWRGNQRSRAFAHILKSIGWDVSLVKGGYRAYRTNVIAEIEQFFSSPVLQLKVIAGFTGTGKTHLLHALKQRGLQVIDLEAIANHKGSLFGSEPNRPQPKQKLFENLISQEIKGLDLSKPIFIEAESNRIGQVFCPPALWKAMKSADVIDLQLPLAERIKVIQRDYAHLLERRSEIQTSLSHLKRHRSSATVNRWNALLEASNWQQLIKELLEQHYDLAYKPAGTEGSTFKQPSSTIALTDSTPEAYAFAASSL